MAKISGYIFIGGPWQRSRTRGVVIAELDARDQPRYAPLPPDGPPTNVAAVTHGSVEKRIALAWQNGTPAPAETEVWASVDGLNFTLFTTLSLPTLTLNFDTPGFNERRWFKLRHVNVADESAFSGTVDAYSRNDQPDAPPTGLGLATPGIPTGETQLTASWTNGDPTAQTEIYVRLSGGTYALHSTAAAGVTSAPVGGRAFDTLYDVFVRHIKSGIPSANSNTASARTLKDGPDAPPTALAVTPGAGRTGQGKGVLAWTNGDATAGTDIYVSLDNGGTWTFLAPVGPGVVTFTHDAGVFDTRRDYRVQHTKNTVLSAFSNVAFGNTGKDIPDADPSALAATVPVAPTGETVVNLSWTNGDVTAGTNIYRNGVLAVSLAAGATSWQDTGRTPDTQYTYDARHVKNGVESGPSTTTARTLLDGPNAAPTTPNVVDNGGGSVTFTWANGDATASTEVYKNDAYLTTVGAGVAAFTESVGGGVTVRYKARHIKSGVPSAFTGNSALTTGATPPAPTLNSVTGGDGSHALAWTNGDATLPVKVWESTDGANFTLKETLAAGTVGKTYTGLVENVRRWYKVAHQKNGFESFSTVLSAWTYDKPDGAATNLVAIGVSYFSANLTWSSGDPSCSSTAYYRVAGGSTWSLVGSVNPGVGSLGTGSIFAQNTNYEWFVRHTKVDNTGTTHTRDSVVAAFKTATGPSITAFGPPAAPAGETQLTVSWSQGTGGSTIYADLYRVSDGAYIGGASFSASGSHTFTGLGVNTQYRVYITGRLNGNDAVVNTVATTLVDGPNAAPSVPGLTTSGGTVNLAWTNGDASCTTEVFRNGAYVTTVGAGGTTYSEFVGAGQTPAYNLRHTKNGVYSVFGGAASIYTQTPPAAPLLSPGTIRTTAQVATTVNGVVGTCHVFGSINDGASQLISSPTTNGAEVGYAGLQPDTKVVYQAYNVAFGYTGPTATVTYYTKAATPATPTMMGTTTREAEAFYYDWRSDDTDVTFFWECRDWDSFARTGTLRSSGAVAAPNHSGYMTGLVNDTMYAVYVMARRIGRDGQAYDSVWAGGSGTTVKRPSVPTGMVAENNSYCFNNYTSGATMVWDITVRWEPGEYPSTVELYQSEDGVNFFYIAALDGGGASTYHITDRMVGDGGGSSTTLYFKVRRQMNGYYSDFCPAVSVFVQDVCEYL